MATLHCAGADSVLSYASMGASAVMNLLQRSEILMVAEGLDLFEVRVPADADIVLIGTAEAEERFLEIYGKSGAANG